MSQSSIFRAKGNEILAHITSETPKDLLETDIRECIQYYNHAEQVAANHDECASAAKNLAVIHTKYITLALGDQHAVQHHLKLAWEAYGTAYSSGTHCKPKPWMERLCQSAIGALEKVLSSLRFSYGFDARERLRMLTTMCDTPGPSLPVVSAKLLMEVSQLVFQLSVTSLGKRDFNKGLQAVHDARRPLTEAQQALAVLRKSELPVDHDLQDDLDILGEDIHVQECVLRSQQSLMLARQYLESAVGASDEVDMNSVYLCLDELRFCTRLAEEKDLETEAEAFALLGEVYAKVLRQEERAKTFYQQSIKLALSMSPKHFGMVEWFKKASEFVREKNAERDRLEVAWKEPFLRELEAELKELTNRANAAKDGTSSVEDFLKFVYEKYPPKRDSFTLEIPVANHEKQRLKKSLIHYHPDTPANCVAQDKWYVACEQISKLLSSLYEKYK
eukprot:m.260158 g.260158  ORF g.260158 m.260158 type:complete len:447 (+) comp38501_c0_seq1:43-1383(+)